MYNSLFWDIGWFSIFRVLGFRGIFRRSAVPRFHLLGFGIVFHRSVIPSFRIWGYFPPFHDSTVPWFHRSCVPSFLSLGSPCSLRLRPPSRAFGNEHNKNRLWCSPLGRVIEFSSACKSTFKALGVQYFFNIFLQTKQRSVRHFDFTNVSSYILHEYSLYDNTAVLDWTVVSRWRWQRELWSCFMMYFRLIRGLLSR